MITRITWKRKMRLLKKSHAVLLGMDASVEFVVEVSIMRKEDCN